MPENHTQDDVDHDDSLQSSQEPNAESCLHGKCQGVAAQLQSHTGHSYLMS